MEYVITAIISSGLAGVIVYALERRRLALLESEIQRERDSYFCSGTGRPGS